MVDGQEVDDTEEFTYLGAIVDKEGGGSIMNSLQKARDAFQRLRRVWAARGIGKRTKIRLLKKRLQEVKDALKRTKPGKADEVDEVCPELLTADMEDTGSRLTSCYNRLWETGRWPVCSLQLLTGVRHLTGL